MIIAVDYDNTYTKDPELFDGFISAAQQRGHRIICVTARTPAQGCRSPIQEVFYTSLAPKREYMNQQGIWVDIWIDDLPQMI